MKLLRLRLELPAADRRTVQTVTKFFRKNKEKKYFFYKKTIWKKCYFTKKQLAIFFSLCSQESGAAIMQFQVMPKNNYPLRSTAKKKQKENT